MSSTETKTLPINKNQFMQLTSGGKEFFEFVLGVPVPTKKNIKNPFYPDTNAGLSVFCRDGKYLYKDFGDNSYQGDAFSFAGHYYHLDPGTQLHEILERGCQDLGIDYYTPVHGRARGIMHNSSNGKMHSSPHCPEIVNFKVAEDIVDYSYWLQFMDETQLKAVLKKYPLRSWRWFEKTKEDTGKKWKVYAKENSPIFAFELIKGELYKIYQPAAPKGFKQTWYPRNAKPEGSYNVFGIDQLPDKCEQVLVVEGPKDMIVAGAYGYDTVALDHAGSMPNPKEIESIKQRTNNIVLLLDNDKSGVEAARKLSEQHQWPYLILPESFNIGSTKFENWGTDIADYFQTGKKEGFEPPFEDFLKDQLADKIQDPEQPQPKEIRIGPPSGAIQEPVFWKIDSKNELKIQWVGLFNFLIYHGFCTLINLDVKLPARLKNNIVSQVDNTDIKHFVLDRIDRYGKELPGDNTSTLRLKEKVLAGAHVFFGKGNISSLRPVIFNPLRSTKETAYFPYRNGIVEATSKGLKITPYKDCKFHIWESQIIDRDFKISDQFKDFTFYKFLENITGDNTERLKSLVSCLGYMLHPYRDPSNPQLLVFYDQQISDNPEGGTGKGIVSHAIGHIKRMVSVDGKNFKFDNPFCWQRISMDTQLVVFQDTNKYFKFERLHSVLTDGISVNKKNRDEFFIPYTDSPKFIINTNFILDAEGATNERRMKEVEFAPYYNATFTPEDEFKELFFHSWNSDKWLKFDNLMMWCMRSYLGEGFIETDINDNSKSKRLFLQKYGEDMLEWIENLPAGENLRKLETFKKYINEVGETMQHKTTARRFYAALTLVSKASDLIDEVKFGRDGQTTYFKLVKNTNTDNVGNVRECSNEVGECSNHVANEDGLPF